MIHVSHVYRRAHAFTRRYRALISVSLLAAFAEASLSGAFTKLMQPMIDKTFVQKGLGGFGYQFPLAIVAIFVVRGMFGYLGDVLMAKAGRGVARDLRELLFGKYIRLPSHYFDAEPVAFMLTRLGSDCDQVSQTVVDALKTMVQQSLQVAAMFLVMIWTSWKVTASVLLLAFPLSWLMGKVGRHYRRIGHRMQDSGARLNQLAEQVLCNHQEVKVYGAQALELEKYATRAGDHRRLGLQFESTRSVASGAVQLTGAIGLALLLPIASYEASRGRITAGDFVSLMTSMMVIVPSLKQLSSVQGMLHRGLASAERLFNVLDLPEEPDMGTRTLQRSEGRLEFRNVSASYPGKTTFALSDITFSARPGTVTAVVGRSGSGKSTLVKLIPRLYDCVAGQILLDGYPLQEYRLADLRRQVAMVSQQVMLFDGSVVDNVAYGELEQRQDKDVEWALLGAHALEFIRHLPSGKDTLVSGNGRRLSGGQRQRIAVARAILKDAPVLILDEATASLDPESERFVQAALQDLVASRTTLVIAHRLSTVEHADQVLVLDQGRIVEQGRHPDLIARGGLYADLYRLQFRG